MLDTPSAYGLCALHLARAALAYITGSRWTSWLCCAVACWCVGACPKSSQAAVLAVTWSACASLVGLRVSTQFAAVNVFPALAAANAEADRRTLSREIVVHSEAARLSCQQVLSTYVKLCRAGASAPEMRIAGDVPLIVDENVDAQRRATEDMMLVLKERMPTWPALALVCAAINLLLASSVLNTPTLESVLITLFLCALAFATRVPAAVIADADLGAAAVEPLRRPCVRGYVWSCACLLVSVMLCGNQPFWAVARVAVTHFAGAVALDKRKPVVFFAATLL